MAMLTEKEAAEKFCPLIGKNCIGSGCMYWTFSDGWNDTPHPSIDNDSKGYCKDLALRAKGKVMKCKYRLTDKAKRDLKASFLTTMTFAGIIGVFILLGMGVEWVGLGFEDLGLKEESHWIKYGLVYLINGFAFVFPLFVVLIILAILADKVYDPIIGMFEPCDIETKEEEIG